MSRWGVSHVCMSHVTSRSMIYVNESCHTYEYHMCGWVMSPQGMSSFAYEWVMSHTEVTHIWMSHVTPTSITHVNESCHLNEWHCTHIDESCHTQENHTYEWVMSHPGALLMWMSHVTLRSITHVNESCHLKICHRTHANESCHTNECHPCERVMSHSGVLLMWMSHVTLRSITHVNESCHLKECHRTHLKEYCRVSLHLKDLYLQKVRFQRCVFVKKSHVCTRMNASCRTKKMSLYTYEWAMAYHQGVYLYS